MKARNQLDAPGRSDGVGEAGGPPVKIVFIMGRGRSGSTVLDNLLGELDGFFSAGEVHNLWNRGLIQGPLWMRIQRSRVLGVVCGTGARRRRHRAP